MNRGFVAILAAQFFSAMADNALLFAAIALMKTYHAPDWQTPVLQQSFVAAYIILSPFVGVVADALPKGRVLLISNGLKTLACLTMLLGLDPLPSYAAVGIGAALYSPAKYGILTEYFPPEKLVWANGWMEGLTVAAIIGGINTDAEFAVAAVLVLYLIAGACNLFIPLLPIEHAPPKGGVKILAMDFWLRCKQLWLDPLGQISLAVTTLFWAAGTTLRLVILSWAAVALDFQIEQATQLTACVAVGVGIGAVAAGRKIPLNHAVRVLPVGIAMGGAVMIMSVVTDWHIALPMLVLIGAMGGYFLVPMNSLLQHRGHLLMGSGYSIAVQNFNENLGILVMLGAYAFMLKIGLSIYTIAIVLGAFLAVTTAWLAKLHRHDQDHGET